MLHVRAVPRGRCGSERLLLFVMDHDISELVVSLQEQHVLITNVQGTEIVEGCY